MYRQGMQHWTDAALEGCSDVHMGANTHTYDVGETYALKQATLIWLPLFVGVGETGASKQNLIILRACDFEVTLRAADTLSLLFCILYFEVRCFYILHRVPAV